MIISIIKEVNKTLKTIEVYSDKLNEMITVDVDDNNSIIPEDSNEAMVGWVHNGWNNDHGGGGW